MKQFLPLGKWVDDSYFSMVVRSSFNTRPNRGGQGVSKCDRFWLNLVLTVSLIIFCVVYCYGTVFINVAFHTVYTLK